MNLFLNLICSFLVLHQVYSYSDICYDDFGCFTTRPPFSANLARPIALLPEKPSSIDTKFYLYTRSNNVNGEQIAYSQATSVNFSPSRETKFIIHGFLHNGFKKWVLDMKDALLRVGDYNVISVDWSKGNGFPYTQATANTQIVGAEISRLIQALCTKHSLTPSSFHIIGHSLGSHIAGYAGARLNGKLARITGLDPAGPYFENTDTIVRLDKSDAVFVDVIHSDGAASINLGLGLLQQLGHVDFYPNGGKDQPNCPATSDKLLSGIFNLVTVNVNGLEEGLACSHMASVYFFTDSIENQNCKYTGYPCNSKEDFNGGKCIACSVAGCNHMGLWASPSNDNGILYFNTQNADSYPYCLQHFQIKLNSNNLQGQTQTRGRFTIALQGDLGTSSTFLLDDSATTFKTDSTFTSLLPSTKNIGSQITGAVLSFTKTTNILTALLYQGEWSFKNIELYHGDSQTYVKLCPVASKVTSGSTLSFKKC